MPGCFELDNPSFKLLGFGAYALMYDRGLVIIPKIVLVTIYAPISEGEELGLFDSAHRGSAFRIESGRRGRSLLGCATCCPN